MRRLGLLGCVAGLLLADGGAGIRPRGSAADYPVHETAGAVTVGAAIVPPDQVRKAFATDLNGGGYIVIEVAVYPEEGKEIHLLPDDFLLRAGANSETVRPASGRAIASILQKKNTPQPPKPGDVTVYPTATIGCESGTDPWTGTRRSGVYTGAGVGVGVGSAGAPPAPGPAATDRDRATMQQELEDKALPEGKTTAAVAGYLYFPKPAGKAKNAVYELTYYGTTRQIKLPLPAPKRP